MTAGLRLLSGSSVCLAECDVYSLGETHVDQGGFAVVCSCEDKELRMSGLNSRTLFVEPSI